MMKYKIVLAVVLSVFLCSLSSTGDELFTWKDEQGGLHITDVRPPDGTEILDITPINVKPSDEELRQIQERREKIRQINILRANQRKALESKPPDDGNKEAAVRNGYDDTKKARSNKKRRERRGRHRNRSFTPPLVIPPDTGGNVRVY